MRRTDVVLRGAVLLTAAALTLAAVGCSTGGSSAASGSPENGLELVKSKCTTCHSFDRIGSASKDRAGWAETIARMRAGGAVLTDAEAASIADYLSANQGK